jgi:endonuclease/exonuclease/phosphatase (EEP) superfamily protein YafD
LPGHGVCAGSELGDTLFEGPANSGEVANVGDFRPAGALGHKDIVFQVLQVANVLQSNRSAERLLEIVDTQRPDLLVALETDAWWQSQLDRLEGSMPFTIKCPLDNLYGMLVYSKLPLTEAKSVFLVEDHVPSMHCLLTLRCQQTVRMHFLHPAPPSPTENTESTARDAELLVVGCSVAQSRRPAIVAGDLNDVAWSATTRLFRRISGLLDPRVGRGLFNTFHADYFFLRWPLDHIFHSQHFTVSGIERIGPFGSDHFALLAEHAFTPGQSQDQRGLGEQDGDERLMATLTGKKNVQPDEVPSPGK